MTVALAIPAVVVLALGLFWNSLIADLNRALRESHEADLNDQLLSLIRTTQVTR